MVYLTYLSQAGWPGDGLVAKALRHQRRQHPCQWLSLAMGFGLDSHEPNAAIGLVTSATASIMAGSRLVVGKYVSPCLDCQD